MTMKAYLRVFDLWEIMEIGGDPLVIRHANPTLAQINQYSEDVAKRYKAQSYLHSIVSYPIFARIMHFDSPKEV